MASTISAGTTAGTAVAITGDTTGNLSLLTQNGANTITVPNGSGAMAVRGVSTNIVAGTAVTASGTAVTFTGIPSWVERITLMLSGVSTAANSYMTVRIGSGSITTSGYAGYYSYVTNAGATSASSTTDGFQIQSASAANNVYALITLCNVTGNTWVATVAGGSPAASTTFQGGGGITLSGVLDRISLTTPVGTDTFDAGTVNILYE